VWLRINHAGCARTEAKQILMLLFAYRLASASWFIETPAKPITAPGTVIAISNFSPLREFTTGAAN